ncbi:MAG: ComEC/Rec2 family competence protein, partial [Eubacteriales bacterium]|nr:ComEC/Rec2 family competence protein [Eubacteriales bacterium]
MEYFRQHPGYFALGSLLIYAAAGYYIPAEIKSALCISTAVPALLFAGAAVFIRLKGGVLCITCVCLSAVFCCMTAALASSYLYFDVKYAKANALAQASVEIQSQTEIEGVVRKAVYTGRFSAFYDIVILRVGEEKTNIKAKLETAYPSDIGENQSFIMQVVFKSIKNNPPDTARYNLAAGFLLTAVSDNPDYKLTGERFSIALLFSRINSCASEMIKLWVGGDEGDFISALALGNRADTPRELKRDIGRLGLTHILAVSGMHLTITLGLLNWLLTALRIHRHIIYIILVGFALIYMGLTGFSPSVLRCAQMTSFYYLLLLIGERPDPISSLFLSGSVICVINPPSVLDIGFILSFSATLGLITSGYILQRAINKGLGGNALQFRVMRWLLTNLSAGICALLFTLPFIWLFYGEISLVSPVMNLLFSPLSSVVLFLAPLFIAVSFFTPPAAAAAAALKLVSRLFISAASFFAHGADYTVSLRYDFVKYIMILCAAVFIAAALMKVRGARLVFIPSLTGIAAFLICLWAYNGANAGLSYVCYYNNGLSDGIAVIDNGLLVCDISDGSYEIPRIGHDIGRAYNFHDIDVYMLTHYHNRHINTFIRLTADTYIKTLCLPEPADSREANISGILVQLAAEHGCDVTFYPRTEGAAVIFGGMTLTPFPYTMISRSTHPVICLAISAEGKSVFYLGGAAYESKNAAVARRMTRAADV